jgi:hypothetical protein
MSYQAMELPASAIPSYCEQLRRHIARSEELAHAITDVVAVITKTDLPQLRAALTSWFIGDARGEIMSLESRSFNAYATTETLVELTKSRDRIVEQIEAVKNQFPLFDTISEKLPGMGGLRGMAESMLIPLRANLEQLEEQISAVQKQLESAESTSAADSRAPQEDK